MVRRGVDREDRIVYIPNIGGQANITHWHVPPPPNFPYAATGPKLTMKKGCQPYFLYKIFDFWTKYSAAVAKFFENVCFLSENSRKN